MTSIAYGFIFWIHLLYTYLHLHYWSHIKQSLKMDLQTIATDMFSFSKLTSLRWISGVIHQNDKGKYCNYTVSLKWFFFVCLFGSTFLGSCSLSYALTSYLHCNREPYTIGYSGQPLQILLRITSLQTATNFYICHYCDLFSNQVEREVAVMSEKINT